MQRALRRAYAWFATFTAGVLLYASLAPVPAQSSIALPLPVVGQLLQHSQLQRIKGSVGIRQTGNITKAVLSSLDFPDEGDAYANCDSLGKMQFTDSSTIMLGSDTDIHISGKNGQFVTFNRGDIAFAIGNGKGKSQTYVIRTPDAMLTLHRGTGFVASGPKGTEIIASDGAAGDYQIQSGGTNYTLTPGHTFVALVQPQQGGNKGGLDPTIVANTTVNNPAIYQFNGGNNPLNSAPGTQQNDPTASQHGVLCHPIAAAAFGPLGWILGGLGAIALIASHPGNNPQSSPSPGPSSNPGATSTPGAGPSSGPSTSPSSGPSAGPSSAPSSDPSSAPSSNPSSSPSSGPSSSPSTAPSTPPSAPPTAAPTPPPTPTPACTISPEPQDGHAGRHENPCDCHDNGKGECEGHGNGGR